mmetsp:Transcript_4030/g.14086  ORF Transcript_4030/g.14086 Transcript_4030/m.14086 type:complete len:405 (-) Transcript_4030:18-1232(-)
MSPGLRMNSTDIARIASCSRAPFSSTRPSFSPTHSSTVPACSRSGSPSSPLLSPLEASSSSAACSTRAAFTQKPISVSRAVYTLSICCAASHRMRKHVPDMTVASNCSTSRVLDTSSTPLVSTYREPSTVPSSKSVWPGSSLSSSSTSIMSWMDCVQGVSLVAQRHSSEYGLGWPLRFQCRRLMGILKYCGGPPAGRKSLSITALSIRSSVHDSLSTHMCTSEWCSFTSWWLSTRRKKAMSPKWWPTRRRASGFSSPRSLPHFAVTVISPSSSRTNWSTTSPYVITTSPLVCFVSRKPFATRLASTSSRSSKMAHRRRIFRLRARRSSCHSRSDSLSKPRAIAYSTLSSSMTTLRWLLESMSASSPKVSPVRITSPTLWPCFTLPSSIGGGGGHLAPPPPPPPP